jgi:hypothetical protein
MSGEKRVWAVFREHGDYSDYRASVVAVVTGTEDEVKAGCARLFEEAVAAENLERRKRSGAYAPLLTIVDGNLAPDCHWYAEPTFTPLPFDLVPASLLPGTAVKEEE